MMLAAVLLSAVLAPQAAPATPQEPAPAPLAVSKTPAPPAPTAAAAPPSPGLAAGLAAFRKKRFAAARAEFEKAVAADPQSAAAAFYLGYTYYKIGEPSRRMDANKQKSRELFAKAFSLDPAFRPTWGR
jgi:Tfp pilus assembly protein PilF